MFNDATGGEIKDLTQRPEVNEYKEIKPEGIVDFQTCKAFWDNLFCSEASGEACDTSEGKKLTVLKKT